MPFDLAKATNVVPEVAMPPPATDHPEAPLFRGLDELRSGHRIGGHGHERILHMAAALLGTGAVFAVLYASMHLLE